MTVDHEFWDELLAGHALHALDPDEERRWELHAADCDVCREQLADFEAVAADMGRALPPVPPPPGGKERLRAALAGSDRMPHTTPAPSTSTPPSHIAPQPMPAGSAGPPTRHDSVSRPGSRRSRRGARSLLAAMTAVVVLAAGAIGYGLHQRQLAAHRAAKLATAEQVLRGIASGQRTVQLQSHAGARGEVVQSNGHVWLVADGLPPNEKSSTYVLWTTTPRGTMTPVATFDVGRDGIATVNRALLPDQAAAQPAFAVSHERGRTPPPAPSTPLLQSQA